MKKLLGPNWLTTIGGIIAAIGGVITLLPKSVAVDPQWSVFIVGVGGAISGFSAKSYNVHSTERQVALSTHEDKLKK